MQSLPHPPDAQPALPCAAGLVSGATPFIRFYCGPQTRIVDAVALESPTLDLLALINALTRSSAGAHQSIAVSTHA